MSHRLSAASQAGPPRVILSFHVVTSDLPRLVAFYVEVLGFAREGALQPIGAEEMTLLDIAGGGERQMLSLGHQRLAIECFARAGRPYPPHSDAAALWFQHLALVVVDIADAHARLRGISEITRCGPQLLPPDTGGVNAFKFRDPDGHPLELLEFPVSQTPVPWRGEEALPGQIALGIDHSAISVRDIAASTRFYQRFGLALAQGSVNQGPAQQNLDDLRDVRVRVAPMRPHSGTPHLELLGYEVPRGRNGPAIRVNDEAATRIAWSGSSPGLIADPDGHLHQVIA